jgi:hypothetical protein
MNPGRRWTRATEALAHVIPNRSVPVRSSLSRDALVAATRVVEALEPTACLEMGSGQSTVVLARAGAPVLVSVDHSRR